MRGLRTLVVMTGAISSLVAAPASLSIHALGTLGQPGIDQRPFALTGSANLAPFGQGNFTANGSVIAGNPTAVGTFLITIAPNTLSGTFSIPVASVVPSGGTVMGAATFTITGGTGAFAGATGTFLSVAGTATTIDAITADITMSGRGDLTAPNYLPAVGSGLRFVAVTPCRLADTREAPGPFGSPTIAGGATRTFSVALSSCGIPANARAYSLNVTVVPHGALGYLTIWPAGQPRPFVSTLNSLDGRIKANAAIVQAGDGGDVNVFVTNTTDVVLDVNGYFVDPVGNENLVYYPMMLCGPANLAGMHAGEVRSVAPGADCSVPATAQALALSIRAKPAVSLGYLTVWPAGQAQPFVSTLNALTGVTTSNGAIVPVGTSGAVNIFVTDAADVQVSVQGYFAPPDGLGLGFYPVPPCRAADTRNADGPLGGPAARSIRLFPLPSSGCNLPATAQAYSTNLTLVPSAPVGVSTQILDPLESLRLLFSSPDGAITSVGALSTALAAGQVGFFFTTETHFIIDVNGFFAP